MEYLKFFVLHITGLLLCVQTSSAQTAIPVTIPGYGTVQGSYTQPPGPAYRRVNTFLGIPYAKPPTGNLRFEPPEEHEPWAQTRSSTSFGAKCKQLVGNSVIGSEDCLFLNVYVPGNLVSRVSSNIPVMIFIHGELPGQENSGGENVGDQLTVEDENNPVILVTFNYRLGILGFATSGNSILPGNMGYKDQAFAIAWVHDNIAAFGGDNTKVTIFGQGSGGEAVKAHILSPMNRDMFQRAIVQSGGPLWSYPNKRDHEQIFEAFGNHFNCMSDSTGIRDCLRHEDIEVDDIVRAITEVDLLNLLTKPVVDGEFLPRNPYDILMSGDYNAVDLMVGFNSDDGSIFATLHEDDFPTFLSGVSDGHESIDAALTACLHATVGMDQRETTENELVSLMEEEYLESTVTDKDNTRAVLDLVRDCMYVAHSLEMAVEFAENGHSTFIYMFDHKTESLPGPQAGEVTVKAAYGSELDYVFGTAAREDIAGYTTNEQRISQSIMKAWCTFANRGQPTFQDMGDNVRTWTAFTTDAPMMITFSDAALRLGQGAVGSAQDRWLPVEMFWAEDVRGQLPTEAPPTTQGPQAQAQVDSCEKFKTDILGLDEFEADLAIIMLAAAVALLVFAVLMLLCKVCRCCQSKQEKYYDN